MTRARGMLAVSVPGEMGLSSSVCMGAADGSNLRFELSFSGQTCPRFSGHHANELPPVERLELRRQPHAVVAVANLVEATIRRNERRAAPHALLVRALRLVTSLLSIRHPPETCERVADELSQFAVVAPLLPVLLLPDEVEVTIGQPKRRVDLRTVDAALGQQLLAIWVGGARQRAQRGGDVWQAVLARQVAKHNRTLLVLIDETGAEVAPAVRLTARASTRPRRRILARLSLAILPHRPLVPHSHQWDQEPFGFYIVAQRHLLELFPDVLEVVLRASRDGDVSELDGFRAEFERTVLSNARARTTSLSCSISCSTCAFHSESNRSSSW
eukprot:97578-Prymnesium_polylepis.1